MRQVAAALACAHGRGIVHRDIKPDNIMVVGDDQVKVTDFGIARMLRPIDAVTTMTSTGMTMGTPLYMAPEQIEGKKVDGRADIYSLGAVLYQAVTARPPFEGEDPLTVAISHVRDAPRPPREINPNVPKDWEALILKALAKDPADRFQSAAALDTALAALSEGTGTGAEDARQTARVRRAVISALATVVVVFVALAVFAYRARSSPGSSTFGRLVAGWNLAAAPPSSLKKPAAVAVDGQGTFYVLDQDANRIERLSSTGALLGSWGILGSGPGQLRNPGALAVDTAGNVYVADSGNDRVEKFSSTGRLLHSWGRSGSGLGQYRFPDGIALDRSGFIYVADSGNNRIQVLSPSGRPKVTNVGTFTALYTGLNHPAGLAVDAKGEVYVADTGDNQIVRYSPDGIIQLGAWPASGDPTGLALDAHGNAYVTDVRASRVQLFSPSGRLLDTWKAPGGSLGPFRGPKGVTVGAGGAVYLADTGNARILKLSSSNRWIAAWGGQSPPRRAPSPESVAVDSRGNVYVADTANTVILKLSPSGQQLAAWTVQGFGKTRFVGPIGGIAVDPPGNVYVTDYDGNRVLKLSATGQALGMWGSGGGPGLTSPQGIAADRVGLVYVADQGNSRVQQFLASGGQFTNTYPITNPSNSTEPYLYGVAADRKGFVYVTDEVGDRILKLSSTQAQIVAARWGSRGSGPGQLRAPQGVAVDDQTGMVYVADTGNNRVQAFSPTGKSLGLLPGHFTRPAGVSVDDHGNLYVADTGNHRIQKFTQ
jgi:DNA-binding beta-propeller fold protein YncE